jgi:hypothetical protein
MSWAAIGGNQSRVYWNLQLNETAQQSSWNLTANNTATVGFTIPAGTSLARGNLNPPITNYTFDFRPTGLQNYTIGSGDFDIDHGPDGFAGTVSGSSSAAAPNSTTVLGTASASASVYIDFDYNNSPTWIDSSVNGTATRGTAYSDGVSANATSSYGIVSGRLPFGLSLNTSNGAITGTPTTVESQGFTIRAYGSNEGSIDTALSINVRPALPVFSDGSVDSSARVGIAYSDGVTASEAASYSVFSGALPNGLSLNTSTGAITGTPTTPGTFTFVIRATNVTGSTNTGTLTITVISAARVWNGTAFVSGLANVWNGTAFVSGTIRVWDGSAWVNTK